MDQQLIEAYNERALKQVALMESLPNYNPFILRQMISDRNPLAVTKELLTRKNDTYGFSKLWELGHQDYSLESLVIRDEYAPLFTRSEINTARDRLGLKRLKRS